MESFTEQELTRKGYMQIVSENNSVYMLDINDDYFRDTWFVSKISELSVLIQKLTDKLKDERNETVISDINNELLKYKSVPLYKRSRTSSKDDSFYHISNFDVIKGQWSLSLKTHKNIDRRAKEREIKKDNLDVARMYMMGDINTPICCPFHKYRLDSLVGQDGNEYNLFEQHHFVVQNRASVQKKNLDPYAAFKKVSYKHPSTAAKEAVYDMMRTNFLGPTAHKMIHNQYNSSDITVYGNDQLPWALQNKKNWNEFIDYMTDLGYSEFSEYDEWFDSLKLKTIEPNESDELVEEMEIK